MTRLAVARWYVDADTLGLAHVLIRARPDVTFPGDDGKRHTTRWTLTPCPVQQTGAGTATATYLDDLVQHRLATNINHLHAALTPRAVR